MTKREMRNKNSTGGIGVFKKFKKKNVLRFVSTLLVLQVLRVSGGGVVRVDGGVVALRRWHLRAPTGGGCQGTRDC